MHGKLVDDSLADPETQEFGGRQKKHGILGADPGFFLGAANHLGGAPTIDFAKISNDVGLWVWIRVPGAHLRFFSAIFSSHLFFSYRIKNSRD